MKKTLKKLLICILIVFVINNFLITGWSYAGFIEDFTGSVVTLLTYPFRIIALSIGIAVDGLTAGIAYSQGTSNSNGKIDLNKTKSTITPFDILFNKVALVDINFFNIPNGSSMIRTIRTSIAGWYYVMRNIAAAILLCVFIYVGIRMAISTVASDKAAYKKMLVDWVVSLTIIFILQYIIVFTLNVNSSLISALSKIQPNASSTLSDAMDKIEGIAGKLADPMSIAATIVFCMMAAQTIGLLISYINRMLKLAFLIIISPLITLTYSIDKMGDGKAQALSMWLKEFIFTVLLQPFHCIIYMAFVSMAIELIDTKNATIGNVLASSIVAMLCLKFTKDAEKILGKIFNFSDHTADSSLGVGMAASAMLVGKAKSIGKGTRKALNSTKNFKNSVGNLTRNAKIEAIAAGSVLSNAMKGNSVSFSQAREDAEVAVTNKEADKIEAKAAKGKNGEKSKYKANKNISEQNADIQKEIQDKMKNTGVTASLAAATVRKEHAEAARRKKKEADSKDFAKKHKVLSAPVRTIRGATSTVKAVKNIARQSEVLKSLGSAGKSVMAGGVALFAGGATYGATGNAFNSFAASFATYRGTNEFLKASSGTVINQGHQIAKGLGAKTKDEAIKECNDVIEQSDFFSDNTEVQKKLDELYNSLDKALSGLTPNEAKNVKSRIQSTVAKQLKENPEATNEELMDKIANKFGSYGVTKDVLKNSNFNEATKVQRQKNLFDTMDAAADIGISQDTFVANVAKTFDSKGSSDVTSNTDIIDNITAKEKASDAETLSDQDAKDISEERSDEGLKGLYDEMEKEIREITKKMGEDNIDDFQAGVLGSQVQALAESQQKIYDQMLDREVDKLEAQVDQIQKTLGQNATVQAQREVDKKIDELMQQYQNLIANNINNTSEANVDKIRNQAQILFKNKWQDPKEYKDFKNNTP